ncbi:nicotinate-nucleotide adenylyltransferase [Endosaccharibacter trunci]|uniref:nicotinate-nucleotide adenylyltransferase n=1 Tax=Endosaccharibacter trunci TaxID=2812733 RepID=UPI003BF58373
MTVVPRWGDGRRLRIGLLGGSFNPAHSGHRQVAELALRRLGLDQVWLLVSPGNPLKPRAGMAPIERRLRSAAAIADGRRVVATDIERVIHTRYTIDTLRTLVRRFPRARFVWLMGADGLDGLPHWRRWREIAALMPIAVLPRPSYNHRALAGRAAHALSRARRPAREAGVLAERDAPAWSFLPTPQTDISATALRNAAHNTWPADAGSR